MISPLRNGVFLFFILAAVFQLFGTRKVGAQTPAPPPAPRQLFDQPCQTCHGSPDVPQAPDPSVLRRMTPERIYESMTTGSMQAQAAGSSDASRRAIAEYLGDRRLGAGPAGAASAMPNRCSTSAAIGSPDMSHAWNGWGRELSNTRFQPAAGAALSAARVPALRVKWALGFPGATGVYGQPTVAAGRVFAGADTGYVHALDQESGCVHWGFQAQAGVRSAVTLGRAGESGPWAAFFGDMKGNVYAVDAVTGSQSWTIGADDHALTRITGAPVLHGSRLYVPVASFEEGASTSARYPCCTFRGSVMALDAATGRTIWKTFTIDEAPRQTGVNSAGTPRFGPSGAAVWSAPAIDPVRNALYVGTGNACSRPVGPRTDALVAFDLDSGRILWTQQLLADDVWIPGCPPGSTAGNCPEQIGPDYDVGASPVLTTASDGRRLLISARKSGQLWRTIPIAAVRSSGAPIHPDRRLRGRKERWCGASPRMGAACTRVSRVAVLPRTMCPRASGHGRRPFVPQKDGLPGTAARSARSRAWCSPPRGTGSSAQSRRKTVGCCGSTTPCARWRP